MMLICRKHGCIMPIALPADRRHRLPLRRCGRCTADFAGVLARAKAAFKHHAKPFKVQRVLPPVIMSERWP